MNLAIIFGSMFSITLGALMIWYGIDCVKEEWRKEDDGRERNQNQA